MKSNRTYYEEALRYVDNAEEQLKKSPIDERYYTDLKYVKSAGGIVYAGVEKSAKWFIELNGIKLPKEAKEPEITKALTKINKKALNLFNDLYSYFHIAVYYNENNNVAKIKESLKVARNFMLYLKPYNKVAIYEDGGKISKIKKSAK